MGNQSKSKDLSLYSNERKLKGLHVENSKNQKVSRPGLVFSILAYQNRVSEKSSLSYFLKHIINRHIPNRNFMAKQQRIYCP
jgi:hypothetical protein